MLWIFKSLRIERVFYIYWRNIRKYTLSNTNLQIFNIKIHVILLSFFLKKKLYKNMFLWIKFCTLKNYTPKIIILSEIDPLLIYNLQISKSSWKTTK